MLLASTVTMLEGKDSIDSSRVITLYLNAPVGSIGSIVRVFIRFPASAVNVFHVPGSFTSSDSTIVDVEIELVITHVNLICPLIT